jgi:anti-sigma factor RsiW
VKTWTDRELLRSIAGELSPAEARELAAAERVDPALAARHATLAARWQALELPPTVVPAGFRATVLARVEAERATSLSWRAAPTWVRAAAAATLVLGIAAGFGAVRWVPTASGEPSYSEVGAGLAESYLEDLGDDEAARGGEVGT